MKKHNTTYYLLFVLLIMGAFAAMAQNNYGITVLGFVAFAFGLLFTLQLLPFITKKETWDVWIVLELVSLIMLAMIMGLRVLYIHFPWVELVFGISGVTLMLVYIKKLFQTFHDARPKNAILFSLVVCFYLSIILYTLSMVTVPFAPTLAEPAGGIAFALLIGFVGVGLLKNELMVGGEKISVFTFVGRFKDRSVVLLSLFLLFTFYLAFTTVGVLPKMYSDEFPQSYFEQVNQAETGKEKPVNGKYKHEGFKEAYNRFVGRHTHE